ncbi:MAG: TRAP transporter small permease [Bacillota bacterium]
MKKVRHYIHLSVKSINILVMFFMFLILLIQVLTRKFFNFPLSWPEELSLITMIWITFFGAYQCTIEGNHLKMDFLESKIPEKIKPYLLIISKGFVIWFLFITCYWGWTFIQKAGNIKMPVSGLPMGLPYCIIWISFLLMLCEFVIQIIFHIKEISNPTSGKEEGEECSHS